MLVGLKGGGWLTVGECFDWVFFFNNGGGWIEREIIFFVN